MLDLFIIPQLQDIPNTIFKLDGGPSHWSMNVRDQGRRNPWAG